MQEIERTVLHIDMDAYFASVEQQDNPSLIGLPVIIGGTKDSNRGVISACSYEARKYGLHSAMPIAQAKRLCPNGIYISGNMQRYQEVSCKIMNIFKNFTPNLYQVSVDEAFLDITGTERLFGSPVDIANKIKAEVKKATGLSLSIGIANNFYLAKLASDYKKPDGLYQVEKGSEIEFIDTHAIGKLWGIGKVMTEKLHSYGIRTPEQIRNLSKEYLSKNFGEAAGEFLYKVARGIDPGICNEKKSTTSSISNEVTLDEETNNKEFLLNKLLMLSENIFYRLKLINKNSYTVFIKIKYFDFTSTSAQKTMQEAISNSKEIYEIATGLFEEKISITKAIRLIGLGLVIQDYEQVSIQGQLFSDKNEKQKDIEQAIFNLKKEGIKITRGSLYSSSKIIDKNEK